MLYGRQAPFSVWYSYASYYDNSELKTHLQTCSLLLNSASGYNISQNEHICQIQKVSNESCYSTYNPLTIKIQHTQFNPKSLLNCLSYDNVLT